MNITSKKRNSKYWDSVAKGYNALYADSWSSAENNYIQNLLQSLIDDHHNILDLGCGTGLGYELCLATGKKIKYTGVDISGHMISQLRSKYPEVCSLEGTMSNLKQFDNHSFDLIISIFTSFSYTDDISRTIHEMHRVLKPGGRILISVLSKWSLRRILKLKFYGTEKYKTRKTGGSAYCIANVFSKKDIAEFEMFFSLEQLRGYNTFGGINFLTGTDKFWKINGRISKLFPQTSHELLLILKKDC